MKKPFNQHIQIEILINAYNEYLGMFAILEQVLKKWANESNIDLFESNKNFKPFGKILKEMNKSKIITDYELDELKEITNFRNKITHESLMHTKMRALVLSSEFSKQYDLLCKYYNLYVGSINDSSIL